MMVTVGFRVVSFIVNGNVENWVVLSRQMWRDMRNKQSLYINNTLPSDVPQGF